MSDFIPGQRWMSTTESELGLGLVLESGYKRVTVLFLACGEKRVYASDNAPLTRVTFEPGDNIESVDNTHITVEQVLENEGLLLYLGVDQAGNEVHLNELDLNHHIQFNKPQDRFFTGQIDPGNWFDLRYESWRHKQRIQQSPVSGLVGGRTAPIAHQLYIAQQAANRYAPRIMLADEVGLGKTIEAGLILHHRIYHDLSQRVLIIVPETLLHQWLVEMLRRFNLRFSIFDEQRCIEANADNPFLSEQLILCSINFFSQSKQRMQEVLHVDWAMVVVDEAHHLQWDEFSPSPEYSLIESLASISPGLLLLTATPEQLGKKSHFARLRLLDPDRFYSFEKFVEEERDFQPVATAARLLLEHKALDKAVLQSLTDLLKQDNVEQLIQRATGPDEDDDARTELINMLLDHHGTGRVLFRNSRQTVQGFPHRQRYAYALQEQGEDTRFQWLLDMLTQLAGEKVLLICQQAQTALDLEKKLKKHSHFRAAVFHEGMTIIERDRAAAYFADLESQAQILVCSEIGSEGRNFQFAQHLILFDLPENPDLLQQRIGRLDRIGQRHTISIHIPYFKNTAEHLLFRWYDEGLNAFLFNHSAAQGVYEIQRNQLAQLLFAYDQEKVDIFIKETQQLAKQLEEQLHNGRDLLLELNSCRQQAAQQLIDWVNEIDKHYPVWPYMEKLLDCYGVDTEYHSSDCHILTPGNHMRTGHFPALPEAGMTITVNRDIALAREDLQFLSWEHPMLTAAMDLVLSSDTGNAAVSVVKHENLASGRFLLEVLFIVECSAPAELQIGRFLPPTPIRVLLDQSGEDLSEAFAHDSFVETEHNIDITQLGGFLVEQRKHINNMIDTAKNKAEQYLPTLIKQSSKLMLEIQSNEIKRLVSLKKRNPSIKQQEIEQQKSITEAAYQQIQAAQLKLDAVRLIISN